MSGLTHREGAVNATENGCGEKNERSVMLALHELAPAEHGFRNELRRWLSGERPMQPRTLAWIDAQLSQ